MNSVAKLAVFAGALGLTFGGALAVGAAVGPIDTEEAAHSSHSTDPSTDEIPRGLAVAQAGFRLVVESTEVASGAPSPFAFRIVDDDGAAITDFQELHERALHLIVVSRNLVDYLHLHPTMDDGGRWTVELPALRPGSYRVFADFQPEGTENLTLGADITVAGEVEAVSLPGPETVTMIDGYTVTMVADPAVGDTEITFAVELDGASVATEPYLGAAGHLVAIRAGDLAYLHVHPHDGDAPAVVFTGQFPSAGRYRLFLDFAHGGAVHTAAFTVVVPDGDAGSTDHEGHD